MDEFQAVLQEGRNWSLMLELVKASTPQTVYISDVQISIKDISGSTVLEAITDRPYQLIKLSQKK